MLRNAFTLLVGAILLILGLMFSVVLIAVVAVLGLVAWGYFWWKTRRVRKAMAEHPAAAEGQVIDGEAIVVEEYEVKATNILPGDPPGK